MKEDRTPRVKKQITDLLRQVRERELSVAFKDHKVSEARRSKGPSKQQAKDNDAEWSKIEAHWKKVHGKDVQMPGGPAGEQRMRQRAAKDGIVKEAKGPSENRALWDKINSKGVVPSIDRERYTNLSHEGLEGPFRMKSGKVVYYDPKAGAYYDRDTDMYLDNEETDMLQRESAGDGNPKQAKLAKMRKLLDDLQSAVKATRGQMSGKSLKEAPIDQVVATGQQQTAKPGQPGQPPVPGQQPPGSQLVPGQPLTPSQQPPAPAGTSTVQPVAGQPTPPQAGAAGGAPVAPAPGTPVPAQGGQANNATTPLEQVKNLVTTLKSPAASQALNTKLQALH